MSNCFLTLKSSLKSPAQQNYNMLRGAAYEEGRIQQLELNPNDCGMKIKNVIQADNGDWHCNVTSKGIYNRLPLIIPSERQYHYVLINE